jgi:hypothetical protein
VAGYTIKHRDEFETPRAGPNPNCINFSLWQAEKLMQFGWEG